MATYGQVMDWVKENKGIAIHHTCWVAHCKAIALGLPNPELTMEGTPRVVPCPHGPARKAIFEAFAELGIPNGRRT
ncbi:hypothetical protein [Paracoccus ravus]|uniref:hypothetical protein n=1 Tax=Paracoccus ravus TaxID=2447760 RepID=UPI00106DE9C7|nr:hypothetical protein [Paracoccus ravus]